jgi:putative transposase
MKMNHSEYQAWLKRQTFTEEGKAALERIRHSEPTRQSDGRWGNVRCRYPSAKMGHMVGADSHTVELAWLYLADLWDTDIIEFWEQPESIKVSWQNDEGRKGSYLYTPDYLAFYENGCTYVECKTVEFLEKSVLKHPGMYVQVDGVWTRPDAAKAAAALGFSYEVWTADKHARLVRNLGALDDYAGCELDSVKPELVAQVQEKIKEVGRISLEDLRKEVKDLEVDDLNIMILRKAIYVDLRKELLIAPQATFAYPSLAHAEAFAAAQDPVAVVKAIDMSPGASIIVDGVPGTIITLGETHIFIECQGRNRELTYSEFEALVKRDLIKPGAKKADSLPMVLNHGLLMHSTEAQVEALRRQKAIETNDSSVDSRTLQRWTLAAEKARQETGFAILGLLPKVGGNRTPRLSPEVLALAHKVIKEEYVQRKAPSKTNTYAKFEAACAAAKLPCCSKKTFFAEIDKVDSRKLVLARKGRRSHYSEFGLTPFTSLSRDTPPHGDHPFHVAHIDHTEMDVELENPVNSDDILRPWLTTLILAHCRIVAAYWLTFARPSAVSLLMVLRICLMRYGRLPQILVVDGGKEFAGHTMALTTATFEVTTKYRPPHQGRFGSPLESEFHSTNCYLTHQVPGNTKVTKNVREVTKGNNPKNLAELSLFEFDDRLRHYFYDVAPRVDHPALLMTPEQCMKEGLTRMGARAHKHIPYTEEVEMLLSPMVRGQGGKRIVQTGGVVKVDNDWYYNPALQIYVDRTFEVRGNPADCRYVFVKTPTGIVKAECRGRIQFFERYPGHEGLVTQIVLDTQSEIYGKRSAEIHAGVNSYEPPTDDQEPSTNSEPPAPTETTTPQPTETATPSTPAPAATEPIVPPLSEDQTTTSDETTIEIEESTL